MRDLYRGLKFIYLDIMKVTSEQYDAIAEAAVKEFIDHGAIWINVRAWGQKKDRTVQYD